MENDSLGDFLRAKRKEKNLTLGQTATACGFSKQYLCDIERGRRGKSVENTSILKLAACLDIPIHQISARIPKIKHTEQRKYAEYYRVLRSNVRAAQVHVLITSLFENLVRARTSVIAGKDPLKILQLLEKTVESLDQALAYRGTSVINTRPTDGGDDKFQGLESRK